MSRQWAPVPGAENLAKEALAGVGLTVMANVTPEQVDWLWPGRIPRGKLTVFEGDPGDGKSTVALSLIARVTTGSPMPDGSPLEAPGHCVLMTAEDGLGDTVRPRLDAAGADPARVLVWEHVEEVVERQTKYETIKEKVTRPPSLPTDLAALEKIVRHYVAPFVVVDVLAAYLGGNVDGHRDQDVRRALMPLAKLAERTGAAIVVIRHLTKSGGPNPMYRGGGSIGIAGAARSVLLAAKDPDDDSRRILAVTKCNVSAPVPALAYRLVSDEEHDCARIRWEGETEHTSADLLARMDDGERSELDELADVLRSLVGDDPVPVRKVKDELRRQGYTPQTRQLSRARDRAGLRTTPPSGFGGDRCFYRPSDSVDNHQGIYTVHTESTRENAPHSVASVDSVDALAGLSNGRRRMAEARLVGNPEALDDLDRQVLGTS